MTSRELEKDIIILEAEMASGKTEERVIRSLNEKRALLAQKQKPNKKKKIATLGCHFEGIRAAQLSAMHR